MNTWLQEQKSTAQAEIWFQVKFQYSKKMLVWFPRLVEYFKD